MACWPLLHDVTACLLLTSLLVAADVAASSNAATSSAGGVATLLRQRQRLAAHKREGTDHAADLSNPCPDVEKPFPCKKTKTCVPMVYVCDDNFDCEDGYDEDPELCTAAHRPPVEDIMHFLDAEQDWLMPELFAGKSVGKVAHGLAISKTVEDFRERVGMTAQDIKNLKRALAYVASGDEAGMRRLGMPSEAWGEVVFFFSKLIKSGFKSG